MDMGWARRQRTNAWIGGGGTLRDPGPAYERDGTLRVGRTGGRAVGGGHQYTCRPMVRPVMLAAAVCPLVSCGPTIRPSFDSPEPAARNAAIVAAARSGDRRAVPDLVRMLDSDDPATRLLAIRTLERLTGQTFGYDHAAERRDREPAVRRWREFAAVDPARPGADGGVRGGTGAGEARHE